MASPKAGFKQPKKETSNMPKSKTVKAPFGKGGAPKKHDCGCGGRGK